MKRVGVLGGGQLGCMLAEALHDLGARVRIYEPEREAPAVARFADVTVAPWNDEAAMRRFLEGCDAVTYETEHVDTEALAKLGAPLFPSCDVLHVTQDRAAEKAFLRDAGLPHVAFVAASSGAELAEKAGALGFPCVVKTARGGYDGKGQAMVRSAEELAQATHDWRAPCVAEEAIDLAMEASCIVGRSADGTEVVFPVFENVHEGHILDVTVLPARIPDEVAKVLQRIALDAARRLEVVGLLTTEFFLAKSPAPRSKGEEVAGFFVYVNELAPRPHNSGHVTRAACTWSQFDVLARVLVGIPLDPPEPLSGDTFCMANLLGDVWIDAGGAPRVESLRGARGVVDFVLYGKRTPSPRRKMGHLVTRASSPEAAIDEARRLRRALRGQ